VAEKKVILDAADADGVTAAAKAYGTSRYSIYEWRRRLKGATTKQDKERALAPRSSKPRRNARKLSEERYHGSRASIPADSTPVWSRSRCS
jgi:hypothetical protein